jgi:hypothetical protein
MINSPSLLASLNPLFSALDGTWIAVIAIAGGIVIAVVAIVGGLITANRRQAMWHETARVALEKGQPMPKSPDDEAEEREEKNSEGSDIRAGLILIAVGGGLYLFLSSIGGSKIGYVGAIPGFIGVALLVFGLITLGYKRKDPPPSDRS